MGQTTIRMSNSSKPAPRWFRKTKKAVLILTVAANAMIASWGLQDQLFAARLQLWCTVGIVAILEALEAVLANGEEYVQTKEDE
jgi:hypothetical protein